MVALALELALLLLLVAMVARCVAATEAPDAKPRQLLPPTTQPSAIAAT